MTSVLPEPPSLVTIVMIGTLSSNIALKLGAIGSPYMKILESVEQSGAIGWVSNECTNPSGSDNMPYVSNETKKCWSNNHIYIGITIIRTRVVQN
ncbi:hypothetical protein H5410_040625 [Solanum commersonii]|uniref:Uncharacterized protein n=1 Tax=Solanum commersonii TaxID=4109 RepID=A0A9J5XRF1_SOLCO|nr:hypothetical protein H5410_040625 [Solanum commersonii]